MSTVDIDDFTQEIECVFEGERYSVRDNGGVLRHQPATGRARSADNKWTFGKENSTNPYLHLSGVRVHRIVATAFHGEPPDAKYVVDHIDSNCRNNRPENLRWLTRLENSLKNPATRKKIEFLCGSVEAFLNNPSMLNDLDLDRNFEWMRAVSPEEARNCLARMTIWSATPSSPHKSAERVGSRRTLDDTVYRPLQKWEVGLGREPGLDLTHTRWCAEYMWERDMFFPSCPSEFGSDPIADYFQKLCVGATLSYADYNEKSTRLKVIESVIRQAQSSILVMCEGVDHHIAIVGIELDKKSRHFIHYLLARHSTKVDADADFGIKKELEDFSSVAYSYAYKQSRSRS